MQGIFKKLNESKRQYKNTAAEKPLYDHSDEKITPKYVGEIQAMIDYVYYSHN